MPITGQGWEFHVQRLGLHKRGEEARTYGSYEVFIDGVSAGQNDPLLKGNICETIGPGRNDHKGVRIAQGRYQLTTQFGARYESIGFSTSTKIAADPLMPGIALTGTGQRSAILIHPGHPKKVGDPPVAYISSIGCFNPTRALTHNDDINFFESRLRLIALIDSLAAFDPDAFHKANGQPIRANTEIDGAFAVVNGEPMKFLDDDTPAVA
jgi:hypothetical protein